MKIINKEKIDRIAPIVENIAIASSQWPGILSNSESVNGRLLDGFCKWLKEQAEAIEKVVSDEK